ncbi:hypothetical protein KGF57_002351 [Candida theae]|uniref:Uncharacterized protein n=1 Tax=Candida theae TaxID=1198502 RepID=A0AAD5BFG5_9ASCO|nr:uncharacterized protein KGF57_002351 [Candida theae]KAI5958917.1 hypothetical protein KGF57_002351 [Candida theae]
MSAETEANITVGLHNRVNKVKRFIPSKSLLSRLKFRFWSGGKGRSVYHGSGSAVAVSSPSSTSSSGVNAGWSSAAGAPDLYPKVKQEVVGGAGSGSGSDSNNGPFFQPYSSRFDDYDDLDEHEAYLSQELRGKREGNEPKVKQEVSEPRYGMDSIAEERESDGSDGTEIVDYHGDDAVSGSGSVSAAESNEEVCIYPTPGTDHEVHTDRSGLRQRIKQERLRTATTPSDSEQSTTAPSPHHDGYDAPSNVHDDSGDADAEGASAEDTTTTNSSAVTSDASDGASEGGNDEASVTNMTRVSGDDFVKSYKIDEPVIDSVNDSES